MDRFTWRVWFTSSLYRLFIFIKAPTSFTLHKREREIFYLTTHSTHLIYGYMASDIWLRTILIVRKETRCRHIGYSYRLAARVLLYAPSHRQDITYHGLCYTSRGALAGTRNSSMGFTLHKFSSIFVVCVETSITVLKCQAWVWCLCITYFK